jgi:hypothetical protein
LEGSYFAEALILAGLGPTACFNGVQLKLDGSLKLLNIIGGPLTTQAEFPVSMECNFVGCSSAVL